MKLLFALVIVVACATESSAVSEWKEIPIAQQDMDWRWCSEHLDGPDFAGKGWCFIGKECRNRFLRKDECRSKPYFCAFADVECLRKNDFENKKVIQKDALSLLQ